MHLEQLSGETKHPKNKDNIKVFGKDLLLECSCKKSATPRRESKPQLFIETRFHCSQERPEIMNRLFPTSQVSRCYHSFFKQKKKASETVLVRTHQN